jgi:hypothetical protein
MNRFIVAGLLGIGALDAQEALAQGTYGPGGNNNFLPNYYNRQNQPLSPYLNLLRGGNTATNYYYGVRPGLMTGPFSPTFGANMGFGPRQTFFPQTDTLFELEDTNPQDGLRPTGHPFGFNNSMGYFGAGSGGGMSATGQRGPGQGQGATNRRTGLLSR